MQLADLDVAGRRKILLEAWKLVELDPKELGLSRLIAGLKCEWLTRSSGDEERRQLGRRPCERPVRCRTTHSEFQGVVHDVALGGLRMSVPRSLPVGSQLRLSSRAPSSPEVRCRVAWCRHGYAGLSFDEAPERLLDSWVADLLVEVGFDESVIFERKEHLHLAPLEVSIRGVVGEFKCIDMGPGGCRLESFVSVSEGREYELHLGPHDEFEKLRLPVMVVQCTLTEALGSYLTTACFLPEDFEQEELLFDYIQAFG